MERGEYQPKRESAALPPLDRWRFDDAMRDPELLWGCDQIGAVLGVSTATVYRYATKPGCPIYKPTGRYHARRSELEAWMRSRLK